MKNGISGVEVIADGSGLSNRQVKKNCIYAESLIKIIKETTGLEPLQGIEKIVISKPCKSVEKITCVVDLRNPETNIHEKREMIDCICQQAVGTYTDDTIEFEANTFNPLNAYIFAHEVGHNVQGLLQQEKKIEIGKKYSGLKDDLIKKIREGECPGSTADNIMAEYAFLHKFGFSRDDLICYEGYVGLLSRIVKAVPKNDNAKRSYSFHNSDMEFFAEMFAMYFLKKEKLAEKGLIEFAEKIIKK